MKVLFSLSLPFFLAHGGATTLIQSLWREIAELGVDVEPVRWWDEAQTGDIIHHFTRPSVLYTRLAQQKGFKVVLTQNLDQTASRSPALLLAQRTAIRLLQRVSRPFGNPFDWEVYRLLDAMVYVVPHEWEVAKYLFDADPTRGHIIPHGLESEALSALAQPQGEEDYLISPATIAPRKNTILLAQAALQAKTPIVFLGKPYADNDEYFLRFRELVDGKYVRYPGFVSTEEKYRYLRGARGFALLSQFESGCISLYEAAAAGLPLFLSALPWATKVYRAARGVQFAPIGSAASLAPALARFYESAHRQKEMTFSIRSWREIAQEYVRLYERVLAR